MEADGQCPYCGESMTIWVDAGGGSKQRYVEDCAVCCRPIEVQAFTDDDGAVSVMLGRSDE